MPAPGPFFDLTKKTVVDLGYAGRSADACGGWWAVMARLFGSGGALIQARRPRPIAI